MEGGTQKNKLSLICPFIPSLHSHSLSFFPKTLAKNKAAAPPSENTATEITPTVQNNDDDEKEESSGSPREIAMKAALLLFLGTLIVSVFSDPMVDVLQELATSLGVSPFYVSFVITPICSNASETISSLLFAAKKKKRNSSMT
jgi:Ca2+/H+ antiporter